MANGPTPKQLAVLEHVPTRWVTTQDVAVAAGTYYADAYAKLKALAAKGLVQTGGYAAYRAYLRVGGRRIEGVVDPELGNGRYWRRPVEVTDDDERWFAGQLAGVGAHLPALYDTD